MLCNMHVSCTTVYQSKSTYAQIGKITTPWFLLFGNKPKSVIYVSLAVPQSESATKHHLTSLLLPLAPPPPSLVLIFLCNLKQTQKNAKSECK